jgi:hypothetical protein
MLNALDGIARQAFAWGRDARSAAQDVRERLIALHPALPMTMVEEAVAWVIGDAEGLTAAPADAAAQDAPRLATREELAQTLSYALRFNLEGKPRRTGHEHLAPLAAAQLAEHLLRSNFQLIRGRARPRQALSGGRDDPWCAPPMPRARD